jgi:hypothetical protein
MDGWIDVQLTRHPGRAWLGMWRLRLAASLCGVSGACLSSVAGSRVILGVSQRRGSFRFEGDWTWPMLNSASATRAATTVSTYTVHRAWMGLAADSQGMFVAAAKSHPERRK